MKLIEAFRLGADARRAGITKDVLLEASESYDPSVHEAPIVIGHPAKNAPAYGWIKDVFFKGGKLLLQPHQVAEEFAEWVRQGRFKKRSISLYTPDGSPVPGKWYVRHLGYLGAQPPRIKGLEDYQFSEDDEDAYIEFAEATTFTLAALARSLREFVIEKFGIEDADNVVPEGMISLLSDELRRQNETDEAFAEASDNKTDDETMADKNVTTKAPTSDEFAEREATIIQRETALQEREAKIAAFEEGARRREHEDFIESLITDNARVLPVHKDVLVEALVQLDQAETTVSFAEGEDPVSVVDALKRYLKEQPPSVDFEEKAVPDRKGGVDLSDVNAVANAAHEFVEEQRQKGRHVSYAEAITHVKSGDK